MGPLLRRAVFVLAFVPLGVSGKDTLWVGGADPRGRASVRGRSEADEELVSEFALPSARNQPPPSPLEDGTIKWIRRAEGLSPLAERTIAKGRNTRPARWRTQALASVQGADAVHEVQNLIDAPPDSTSMLMERYNTTSVFPRTIHPRASAPLNPAEKCLRTMVSTNWGDDELVGHQIGTVTTFAGDCHGGHADGGPGKARFFFPHGLAMSKRGDYLFVADSRNHR
eukprot:2546987-Pyramimonas_sp.AAC.1